MASGKGKMGLQSGPSGRAGEGRQEEKFSRQCKRNPAWNPGKIEMDHEKWLAFLREDNGTVNGWEVTWWWGC